MLEEGAEIRGAFRDGREAAQGAHDTEVEEIELGPFDGPALDGLRIGQHLLAQHCLPKDGEPGLDRLPSESGIVGHVAEIEFLGVRQGCGDQEAGKGRDVAGQPFGRDFFRQIPADIGAKIRLLVVGQLYR